MKLVRVLLLLIFTMLSLFSCKTWVGDQKISYEELCSRELSGWCGTNNCQHEEDDNYYRFQNNRLFVPVGTVHDFLGRVISDNDYRRPLPMLDFEQRDLSFYKSDLRNKLEEEPNALLNYYYFAFDREFQFDVVSISDIEASINASLELVLIDQLGPNSPTLISSISNSIAMKLNEASFTKGRFQILKLKPYIIDELRLMNENEKSHPLYSLWSHLKENPKSRLIESIAVITSSGSISKARFSELNSIIQSEIDKLEIKNSIEIASGISISVIKTLDEKIEIDTKENASIFSYGLWTFN